MSHFYEKPIGTSKTGNSVFLCTPTSTLDVPKYSILDDMQARFLARMYSFKNKQPFTERLILIKS